MISQIYGQAELSFAAYATLNQGSTNGQRQNLERKTGSGLVQYRKTGSGLES